MFNTDVTVTLLAPVGRDECAIYPPEGSPRAWKTEVDQRRPGGIDLGKATNPLAAMTDVFVSYKREDQARVQPLVDALSADGLTVWWDNQIGAGSAWRRTIESELQKARCVVVVWSETSVGPAGEFVQDEAGLAKSRGVYLPVRIDDVSAPLGFRQVQVIALETWTGRRREATYQALLKAIHATMERESISSLVASGPPVKTASALGRPRLAVLAFEHPSGDEEQAAFAEGLAEDLIAGLSRSRLLAVTPWQSSLTYSVEGHTTPQVCADLGVDYIVQGSIRRLGQRLRISASLVSGAEDRNLWSVRHERSVQDQFALIDEMALAIVGAIEPAVLEEEQALVVRRRSPNPGHWELFVQGRRLFWRSNYPDIRKAQSLLTQALDLQPDDSPTLALLSHCHMFYVWADIAKDLQQELGIAHEFALRSVACDPADAFAHFSLGTALDMLRRHAEARGEFLRALELNPYHAASAGMMGRLSAFEGDLEPAMSWSDRAIVMSPNDPHLFLWYWNKAVAGFAVEDYPLATRHALDTVARAPFLFGGHLMIAASYAAAGEIKAAKQAFQAARKIRASFTPDALRISFPFIRSGDGERFENALRQAGWDG